MTYEQLLDLLTQNGDEGTLIAGLGNPAQFSHEQLLKLGLRALRLQKLNFATRIMDHALIVPDKDFVAYQDLFYHSRSLSYLTKFIDRYRSLNEEFHEERFSLFVAGFLLDQADILETIEDLDLQNPDNIQRIKLVLNGIVYSGRFALFEKIYESFSAMIAEKFPGNPPSAQNTTRSDLLEIIKSQYIMTATSGPLFDYTYNNMGTLYDLLADVQFLFRVKVEECNIILAELSEKLEEALDKKEVGLSRRLRDAFPVPTAAQQIMLFNLRSYPKISALNPNQVKIKKYSALKELLHQFLKKKGLMPQSGIAPDKYFGFVEDSNLLQDGLFEEAMYTIFFHGKIPHLIQWYIIVRAVEKNLLNLRGISFSTLLEAFLMVKNHAGTFWEETIDVSITGHGYSSPYELIRHLLLSNNCIGSYLRSSLDGQLTRMATCYHKIPYVNVEGKNSIQEITHAVLFYKSVLDDGVFFHAISPQLRDIFNIALDHYRNKQNVSIVAKGRGMIIRANPIQTPIQKDLISSSFLSSNKEKQQGAGSIPENKNTF